MVLDSFFRDDKATFMSKAIFLFAILLVSCSAQNDKQDIKLEVVRMTSDLLQCQVIYGYNEKSLYQENEILIQVGLIDTTTEQSPIKAAIVHINRKELVLDLKSETVEAAHTIQIYFDGNYTMTLNFKKKDNYDGGDVYNCTCTLSTGKLSSRYELVGKVNLNL